VPLAAVADPRQVMSAIAAALDAGEGEGRDPLVAVTELIAERATLLVLDNFEQVLDAAPEVSRLLASAPELKVVVTSRAALRVSGEHELPVPPLDVPAAVALFLDRARARAPSFAASDGEREPIEEICRRLDGLPLAIELAAARAKVLPAPSILERLEHRLDLLEGAGVRDAPARQRTLRATVDWSHDLLDQPSRAVFAHVGVFVGGWTLEAAEAVCGAGVLDGLAALADQSLIARAGPRFTMLETLREYALERLSESGEARAVRRRHGAWCLALATEADQGLAGPASREWLERLDADRDNLHAAVGNAVADGDSDTARLLCGALWRYWLTRGQLTLGRRLVADALEAPDGSARAQVRALIAAAILASEEGDGRAARERFEEGLELARLDGDDEAVTRIGSNLGTLALYEGDHEEAIRRYEEFLSSARSDGDDAKSSLMLHNLASAYEGLGRRERAVELLRESVLLARSVGNPVHLSSTLRSLGRSLLQAGEPSSEALPLLSESLSLAHELDERPGIVECLDTLAGVARRNGDAVTGALLLGAGDATREAAGAVRHPDELPWARAETAALRDALGEPAFAAAVARGRELSVDEAVARALAVAG
jgi:predicted ATPase